MEETTSFGAGEVLGRDFRATSPEAIQLLTQELERVSKTAKDYVVPGEDFRLAQGLGQDQQTRAVIDMGGVVDKLMLDVGPVAHEQLAEKTGVPQPYYNRMRADAPLLLHRNVNHWLGESEKAYLARTLDDRVRAFLSDRYRALDNYDLAFHTFAVARDAGAVVERADLTDEHLYLRMLASDCCAKITGRIEDLKAKGAFFAPGYKKDNGRWGFADDDDAEGDWIIPGATASNSEVGRGGLNVEVVAYRAACVNWLFVSKAMHKVHLGGRLGMGFQLADDTRDAKDKALWLEVRDVVRAAFDKEAFMRVIMEFNQAAATQLEHPVEAVDVVCKSYGFSDEDRQGMLDWLMAPPRKDTESGTVWGLVNAVTALANKKQSVETEIDYQRAGGELLIKAKELVPVRVVPR